MNILDLLKGAFRAAKEEGIPIEGVDDTTTPEQALAAAVPADPRVAELQAKIATMEADARQAAAEAWATTQIQTKRATVGERAHLVALHLQAAADDAAHPVQAGQASRTATLETTMAARPQHQWSNETVPVTVLPLEPNAAADAAARKQRLMNMTQVGRAALKLQK